MIWANPYWINHSFTQSGTKWDSEGTGWHFNSASVPILMEAQQVLVTALVANVRVLPIRRVLGDPSVLQPGLV